MALGCYAMRAIEIINNTLQPAERPLPVPASGQVLIKVTAAGINRPDVMQRQGLYPPPAGSSDIPGLEISGTVVGIGHHVSGLLIGDKVCALVTGVGYAEFCVASSALCLPIPDGLSLIQAAALPETFFTVWSNVFDLGGLTAGETLLVQGGTSGIGTTAIQLARNFGANVIATAGSDIKCEFCRQLGAYAAINYKTHDFVEEIKKLTNNNGVNVILDSIGGDYFPRHIKCLADEGRLVQIGLQNGVKAEINLLPLLLKRVVLTGSTLRARPDSFKAAIAQSLLQRVWPLLACAAIEPVIDSVFALEDAVKAHALMESSTHIGKIVLQV